MLKNIAIIGGDLRIVKLAEMLAKEGVLIKIYALENAENLKRIEQIKQCDSLEQAVQNVECIIGPIPLANNLKEINTPFSDITVTQNDLAKNLIGKKFISGNIKEEFYELTKNKEIEIIDLLKQEELVVLNTIATAEGAIQIAMQETIKTLHRSNVLVLGFGRVGKMLANMLKGIGANVYCEARKQEDLAWIKAYGYKAVKIQNLIQEIEKFDIIMNTIPSLIIGKEELSKIGKDCLIIDLASKPGGIDKEEANRMGIKVIHALALPGKVAPLTSAEYIKETIENVLKEVIERG